MSTLDTPKPVAGIPLVSVIIPVKNGASTINTALDSVALQTFLNIEVIVVDDHSTDGTRHLLRQRRGEILFLESPGNGAPAARNYGYRHSSGKYIQFLDADDFIAPSKIARQVEALEASGLRSVCATYWNYAGDQCSLAESQELRPRTLLETDNPVDVLTSLWITGDFFPTISWLVPRFLIDTVGLWNESLLADQDGDFFGRLILGADRVVIIPEPVSFYRKPSINNVSQNKNIGALLSRLRVANDLVECLASKSLTRLARRACFVRLLAPCLALDGAISEARPELARSYSLEKRYSLSNLFWKRPYLKNLVFGVFGLKQIMTLKRALRLLRLI